MSLYSLYNEWKHERYLKKMGWSQRVFELHNDPDYQQHGHFVKRDMFHGYPYVFEFTDAVVWNKRFGNWTDGVKQMNEWCDEHCTDKWRDEILPVNRDWHASTINDWTYGVSGLSDQVMFVAFKNEQDAVLFGLIWSM